MATQLSVNLEKVSRFVNRIIFLAPFLFFFLGLEVSFYFHFLTVAFATLLLINLFYLKIQKTSTLLSNYGILAQLRFLTESVGPELRQYLFMSDTEEKPFNRIDRSDVYRKSKDIDSTTAFGSQRSYQSEEIKLAHSMFPTRKSEIKPFSLTFGEERKLKNKYTIHSPIMISAMSYGALSINAVRALARGSVKAGIPMNTGEGGYPKYHLMEGADIIFQMGTAKFGVRNDDGSLNQEKLKEISQLSKVKMVEIKLSQGAKPGKGGLLPKEKISDEVASLRGVPKDHDVVSPPFHTECSTVKGTINFIKLIQDITKLPTGIKLCLGREKEFDELIKNMKNAKVFPDYIDLDGAEGGTGAAPKSFMDDIGLPLFDALEIVIKVLEKYKVRNKLKVVCSGKLINTGAQLLALSYGADAIYTARGFMLSLGCIQALQCNKNTCPVGITSQDKKLYQGLDIENKSERVKNYVHNLMEEHYEIITSLGLKSHSELSRDNVYKIK